MVISNAISISIQAYVHEFKQEHAPLVDEKIRKETTLTGTPEELVKRSKRCGAWE
jgi:hypothetical protein